MVALLSGGNCVIELKLWSVECESVWNTNPIGHHSEVAIRVERKGFGEDGKE